MTTLHLSALHGNERLFHLALGQGPDINIRESVLGTPLCCVIQGDSPGHIRIFEYLLQHDADPHLTGAEGMTPLHLAASLGHSCYIDPLLKVVADVNASDENNMSPLHYAVERGDVDILGKLLKGGADIEVRFHHGERQYVTILQFCVLRGSSKTFQALLDHGASMGLKDSFGSSPLHTACMSAATKKDGMAIFNFVLTKTGNVNVPNDSGRPPIFHAASIGSLDVVKILIEHGADVDAVDNGGATAAHAAITNGHVDVVRILLEAGADVMLLDGLGESYLHKAAQKGSIALVELFLEAGIGVDALDNVGSSALCEAIQAQHPHVADYLVEKGADAEITKKFYFRVKVPTPDGTYKSAMVLRRDTLPPAEELNQPTGGQS